MSSIARVVVGITWATVPGPTFQAGTGSSLSFASFCTEISGRSLTYSSVGATLPTGFSINNTTGALDYSGAGSSSSNNGVVIRATSSRGFVDSAAFSITVQAQSAGLGFVTRPYFFQNDSARLLASIAANEPQATGSASNSTGQPLGFITMMNNTLANRAANNDISTWNIAIGGWLKGDNAMMDLAKAECLAKVRANPDGTPLSGDQYQRIEGEVFDTALVVDCCYSRFSASERAEVAAYVNGALTYGEGQNLTFWPFSDPHNNYWQNHHLAVVAAGICSEGWNSEAASWRAKAATRNELMVSKYTSPFYTGPQITEGHYYSNYTSNSLWALRQYDAVMGTNYTGQLAFTTDDQLNLALYQVRPHNGLFFHIGSEAANATGPFHGTSWRLWHQLIASNPTASNSRVAKTILQSTAVSTDANNFWSRSAKAFDQFYWSFFGTSAAALSAKTDRRLVLPTPGGAMTHIRSAQGWDTAATRRAAIMFHHRVVWTGSEYPGYSHANVDSPGFQWGQNGQWLVMDPEARGSSGIDGELGGSALLSDLSNIITLASAKYTSSTDYPVTLFNEDNTAAAVPHYYVSINAQPYWTMCSIYRRQYVWMDDLQVVVIHDRVATSGANTKTFRLHFDGTTSIASGVATVTVTGGGTLLVRDLYSTGGAAIVANANTPYSGVTRLTQADTGNDIRSLKVLSVNGRCTSATLSSGVGYLQADMTINGVARSVRFYDDATHALVT